MSPSLVDADSLLAVDVGSVTTRAALFDVVEGYYRFIASGHAPTTAVPPFRDISEGVRQAIENLQIVTGRTLLNENHQLIMPMQESQGVDLFASTLSAGPVVKTAVVGLLNDVSLESAQRLARSVYGRVVETIGLNDTRKPEEQIDSLLRLRPDLVLITGGTDGGATRSVEHMMDIVGLACYIIPTEKRPAVLYAGNNKLADDIKTNLQSWTSSLHTAPNVRPEIAIEDLQPAQRTLAEVYAQIRRGQMNGVDELNTWSGGTLVPTAYAEGRMIRFLSQVYDPTKGLLGVDLGASAAVVAASFGGELTLGVYPQLGLGEGLSNLLRYTTLDEISRWIALDIPGEAVRDYIYQKSVYPASLPATVEDLAIEQAIARQSLHVAMNSVSKDFPRRARRVAPGLMPHFEPILAAGSAITRAPTLGQGLLIVLDGVQPMGITTIILDQNNLLPALGAAASRNPILPIQVLESGAFLGLATVVTPYVIARLGTPVLRARLVYQNGNESRIEVKHGALEVLPLPVGETGRLYLQPQHHADIGFGPGKTRNEGILVTGTALGVVIDARGRPLRFPADAVRRREIIKKWSWTLGG